MSSETKVWELPITPHEAFSQVLQNVGMLLRTLPSNSNMKFTHGDTAIDWHTIGGKSQCTITVLLEDNETSLSVKASSRALVLDYKDADMHWKGEIRFMCLPSQAALDYGVRTTIGDAQQASVNTMDPDLAAKLNKCFAKGIQAVEAYSTPSQDESSDPEPANSQDADEQMLQEVDDGSIDTFSLVVGVSTDVTTTPSRGRALTPLQEPERQHRFRFGESHAELPKPKTRTAVQDLPVALDASVESAGPVVGIEEFTDIYTRFQTPLEHFIFRLVGNYDQAQDLVQDVFVKAHRAFQSGTKVQAGALSSWLYRIASNTTTDALRRRRLIAWLPLSLFNEDRGVGAGMPTGDQVDHAGESHESSSETTGFANEYDGGRFEQHLVDNDLVHSILQRLPEKYRIPLLLFEHEGYSCAEIAEILHLTASAVKMRLMRARERFILLYKRETEKMKRSGE